MWHSGCFIELLVACVLWLVNCRRQFIEPKTSNQQPVTSNE